MKLFNPASASRSTIALVAVFGCGAVNAALPNGIASGDIAQTSAVLWARCDTLGALSFQVATDPLFSNVVQSFSTLVTDTTVTVKQSVSGLMAGNAVPLPGGRCVRRNFRRNFLDGGGGGPEVTPEIRRHG